MMKNPLLLLCLSAILVFACTRKDDADTYACTCPPFSQAYASVPPTEMSFVSGDSVMLFNRSFFRHGETVYLDDQHGFGGMACVSACYGTKSCVKYRFHANSTSIEIAARVNEEKDEGFDFFFSPGQTHTSFYDHEHVLLNSVTLNNVLYHNVLLYTSEEPAAVDNIYFSNSHYLIQFDLMQDSTLMTYHRVF
jgi:hypothetical protein